MESVLQLRRRSKPFLDPRHPPTFRPTAFRKRPGHARPTPNPNTILGLSIPAVLEHGPHRRCRLDPATALGADAQLGDGGTGSNQPHDTGKQCAVLSTGKKFLSVTAVEFYGVAFGWPGVLKEGSTYHAHEWPVLDPVRRRSLGARIRPANTKTYQNRPTAQNVLVVGTWYLLRRPLMDSGFDYSGMLRNLLGILPTTLIHQHPVAKICTFLAISAHFAGVFP